MSDQELQALYQAQPRQLDDLREEVKSIILAAALTLRRLQPG